MTCITFLGSCATQTAEQDTVSFVISCDNINLLVDTGPNVVKRLYQVGLSPANISAVIVTHKHGDHALGFPYFIFMRGLEKILYNTKLKSLIVITPSNLSSELFKIFNIYYTMELPFSINTIEIDSTNSVSLDKMKLTFFYVHHTVPTIGFVLNYKDKKIVYSSDTISFKQMVNYADNADVLIHSVLGVKEKTLSKITKIALADEVAKIAQNANVKQLIIVHFLPTYIGKEDIIKSVIRKYYDGKIVIPKPGDKIIL